MKDLTITCPHCQHEIDVEETLAHQIKHQLSQDLESEKKKLEAEYASKFSVLEQSQKSLDAEIEKRLEQERSVLESDARAKISEEWTQEKLALEQDIQERSEKLKTFKEEQLNLLREKRELQEKTESLELEVQRKLEEERSSIVEKVRKQEGEKHFMELKEKENLVNSLRKEMGILQRKASQGSMQSQGEVQEMALEELLTAKYPLDQVEEVKKGTNGADVIHHVMSTLGREVGLIAFESKRTKSFSDNWIDKLKEDMKIHGADLGVIVTEAMPKDMEHFGLRNGIWICSFQEVEGLSAVLRESLVQIGQAKQSQVGKGDKMEMLYEYLCSNEFKLQIEGIVEAFSSLKVELEKEKRAMKQIWKRREKQIDRVIDNTCNMHGSIRGIAGNAVAVVEQLELPSELIKENV